MAGWFLSGKPYEVQTKTLEAAEGHDGFGHWLEPGLGKTAVQYNEITKLALSGQIDAAVGFMPYSILQNWVDEGKEFSFKGTPHKWHDLGGELKNFKGDVPLALINFESMITRPCQDFLDGLIKRFDKSRLLFFIDESSRIKTPKSKRSMEAQYWGHRVKYRRTLTGTPMTKEPLDLWPQLKFMGATKMDSYPFRNRYSQMGGFKGRQVIGVREDRVEELQRLLASCTFLGKKEDWTDLPEKIYEKRNVEMTDRQKQLYMEMYEDFLVIVDDKEFEANLVLNQLAKLQQITCGFIKQGDDVVDLCGDKNPRVLEVVNLLEETSGKAIVFAWHHWSIDKLTATLKAWNPAVLRGGMKSADFEAQKRKFRNDPTCRVNIVQISSGGIGLTLLGDNEEVIGGEDKYGNLCHTTIYFENSFDLEHRIQSENRNHRHGQRRPVTYFDMMSSPVDVKVIGALQRKLNMANTILNPSFWH